MIRFINPGIQPPIYLDTANNRVGINTATPDTMFEVLDSAGSANIRFSRTQGSSYMQFAVPGGTPTAARIGTQSQLNMINFYAGSSGGISAGDFGIGNQGSPRLLFDASQDAFRIDSGSSNAPAATAILDVVSTTKGFLPPRMTTTQKNAISSPATGLVVYDSTLNKLCVYTGAGWETVTSV